MTTAIERRPALAATVLAKPMGEPPPITTRQSAFFCLAWSIELGEPLARVAGLGQLMDVDDAAGACDWMRSAVARLEVVQRISARERLCRSSSAGTACTVPRPNSTRTACD